MHKIYLSMGSNVGNRLRNLSKGLTELRDNGINVLVVSSVYETSPVGYRNQRDFLNIACLAETVLSPEDLLRMVKEIESDMGRKKTVRFGPRNIDIDILLYDDISIDTDELTIPHARMAERAFVLVPLDEIAGNEIHPVLKKTVRELFNEISSEGVRLYPRRIE